MKNYFNRLTGRRNLFKIQTTARNKKVSSGMTIGFVLSALLLTAPFQPAWAGNTEEFTINGLKVVLKKNTANAIIATHLYIRGGVLNLTPETAGLESLLFEAAVKGTAKFPKEKLNAELARMGAQITGESNRDYGVMRMRCVKTHFSAAWDIFADVITNPALDPQEVELARERLLASLRQRQDNPDAYLELPVRRCFSKTMLMPLIRKAMKQPCAKSR